jgi:hypothetical protein
MGEGQGASHLLPNYESQHHLHHFLYANDYHSFISQSVLGLIRWKKFDETTKACLARPSSGKQISCNKK